MKTPVKMPYSKQRKVILSISIENIFKLLINCKYIHIYSYGLVRRLIGASSPMVLLLFLASVSWQILSLNLKNLLILKLIPQYKAMN